VNRLGASPDPQRTTLRSRLLFAGLYFAEGGPIGFIWWALPVWMRTSGAEPGEIARVMALVTWPWALKFLWAPLVDVLRTPRFGLRAWILCSQLAMALSLAPLLFVDLGATDSWLPALLVLHAVAAATQDAAIDTLAVNSIPVAQRGAINGWMQTGMLLGRSIFGGGAVLLAAQVGQRAVIALLMIAVLVPAVLALRFATDPPVPATPRAERLADYGRRLRVLVRERALWIGLLLAATVGAGFEGLTSLAGPLLLDHGVSEERVGRFFLVPAVVAMALGALLGGRLSDRFGRARTTAAAQGLAALCVLAVGWAVWNPAEHASTTLLIGLLGLVYFCAGAGIAALYGLLMSHTRPRIAAFQFCVFMAGINLCMIWSTRLLGFMVDQHGYGPAVLLGGCLSLAALPLTAGLRTRQGDESTDRAA
jgi:MFS transporter, PAT family, beta-lactamase induction signal transducer AmpG